MQPRPLVLLFCFALGYSISAAEKPADKFFFERVKPLLDSRCLSCHGAEKQKGGLRLDSRAAMLKGGENGPAIVPGKPAKSLLVQAVMHSKPDLGMPPKEKLTKQDIAILEKWIRDGAPWPESAAFVVPQKVFPGERIGDAWSDPRNPIVKIFGGQRLDLWSLKPIKSPALPKVKNKKAIHNPVDAFVLSRLEKAGLKFSPEADRRTLARRIYFDLTGLPPTPEEMEKFLADKSPDAYEQLVDKLLDSPRYGEHWARQWLDVVRYSDSNGFDWDEFRPQAWRFRDYVIRSFNADKPFDQFIREQLAGDELLDGPPKNSAEQDCLIATGYLRLGPQDNSAALFNEQARSRAELMADLTETTSSAFLGLTMACCRCHDHKYDPLSQADHYRLRAFFEPVKYADNVPLDFANEQEKIRAHNAHFDSQIKPMQEKSDALLKKVKERLEAAKKGASEKEILDAPNADEKSEHEKLTKEIEALNKQKRTFTLGLLMKDSEDAPPVTKILFQGDYKQERDPVEPGFISALDPNPAKVSKPANSKTSGRRLTLANWIVSTNNPLTARVLVNRVWQGHFGRGLVATPNDFGLAGARPTHPELLDWLATEVIREGWSLKKLHRLVVTSATYRQSSCPAARDFSRGTKIDSENALLWRQNLRRLSAEELRDSLLAVSGALQQRDGGPAIWPELPADVLQANPALLDDNPEKTKGWYPSSGSEQNFRSIFLVQKRTVKIPFMETFDLPENATSCPRRSESVVAPQALTMMNGSTAVSQANALAQRVERESGANAAAKVERIFSLALQRAPTAKEKSAALVVLQKQSLAELCRALLNLNEFFYFD